MSPNGPPAYEFPPAYSPLRGASQTASIAVMGATGTGKSAFINLATESRLQVSDQLGSCTHGVTVTSGLVLDGCKIQLIDTPGFGDTDGNEADILMVVGSFLETQFRNGTTLHGIIYLHRISDVRMSGSSKRSLTLLKKLCGNHFLRNVVIVTTMWDKVSPKEGEVRERQLITNERFFKPFIDEGAVVLRHNNTIRSAQSALQITLANIPLPLNIQLELVYQLKSISNTEVGLDINNELKALNNKCLKEIGLLTSEIEEAKCTKDNIKGEELGEELSKWRTILLRIQHGIKIIATGDYTDKTNVTMEKKIAAEPTATRNREKVQQRPMPGGNDTVQVHRANHKIQ